MTVYFIGAGPGAPDLITLRGRDLLARCPVCLYAGSLVPREILAHCPPQARIVDTAPMTLDDIMPRHTCAPCANPMCGLRSRKMSNFSGSPQRVSSWLALPRLSIMCSTALSASRLTPTWFW